MESDGEQLSLSDQQVTIVEKSISTNQKLLEENSKLREELKGLKEKQEGELKVLSNSLNSGNNNARRRQATTRQKIRVPPACRVSSFFIILWSLDSKAIDPLSWSIAYSAYYLLILASNIMLKVWLNDLDINTAFLCSITISKCRQGRPHEEDVRHVVDT